MRWRPLFPPPLLVATLLLVGTVDALRAAVPATAPTTLGPAATLATGYSRLTTEHYLPCAFAQAGVLASCADTATQLMEGSGTVSIPHVTAMAVVAASMSGAANAVWLRQLEARFPGKGAREVAAKTLIHAIIIASIINSAYLVGVPALTHLMSEGTLGSAAPAWCASVPTTFRSFPVVAERCHPAGPLGGWSVDEFVTLTKLEVAMFIPYNTLAFKFVPPQVRPLTHAMISATFNVAVSAVTLGYFDEWCERAAHAFG